MGIIAKQTIKGSFWIYLGVLIGFITTSYFYPNYLSTEQVGLIGLLVSYAQLMGQLFLLGLPGVINRLFAYFRNSTNGHNGFLRIAFTFCLLGMTLFLGTYFLMKPTILKNNFDDSPLFIDYLFLIIPMTLSVMFFNFLDFYNKVLYNATLGIFIQEFLQKVFILANTILYALQLINFSTYIILYAILFSLKALLIFFYLLQRKEIQLAPLTEVYDATMRKEVRNVALFSLAGGIGSMIVFKFDKIIINHLMDLAHTGVYTIAFYFGSLISKPSQPLLKISSTLIAEAWKKNDLELIKTIYKKSCINQFIIGGFLFLALVVNLDNILIILGDDYLQAKWTIFFIGLGYLIDLITGANGQIISLSKNYRYGLFFVFIIIISTICFMFLLIPIWGIVGAAMAIASAFLINNLLRFIFLKVKFDLQPFNYKFIVILTFYTLVYLLTSLVPVQAFFLDLFIRSAMVFLFTLIFFFFIPLSEDVLQLKKTAIHKIQHLLKK